MKATRKFWLDGKFVNWDNAKIHVFSHGLHYGYGIFEGIRRNDTPDGPAIFRLGEHVDRLISRTKIYRMSIPYSKKEIVDACIEVVRQHARLIYPWMQVTADVGCRVCETSRSR